MRPIDIIVPVKNEQYNIEKLVARIDQSLTFENVKYNLIVVDDHSSDATASVVNTLSKKYPIRLINKSGKPGKAFSIIEGATQASSEYVVMIDADLQYAPETIPSMIRKAQSVKNCGVVIANRKVYKSSYLRRFISRANSLIFGRILFGLNCDIQSGLKLVKRDVFNYLDKSYVYPWAIDIPLLFTARELGYSIESVDIVFEKRKGGESKIRFLKTIYEIVLSALSLRISPSRIYSLPGQDESSPIGAGLVYKRKRFITHSKLHHSVSSYFTLTFIQKFAIAAVIAVVISGFVLNKHLSAVIIIALLSIIYFIDVLFNLYLVMKSLHFPPEIDIKDSDLSKIQDSKLPIYSILCPLYHESHLLPQFVSAINSLDYPKSKLEVLLLFEEDDSRSIEEAQRLNLPSYIKVVVVPQSLPKTKPKACNYGLTKAKGEYLTIYDAEDKPDPLQLKKAVIAFKNTSPEIVCLQAKLNYYNPHQNLLTKLFTAEYSLWFDVILTGLQSIDTAIPLGGTSNHFITSKLKELGGWDAFNVTEDCDLGARLFKRGYKTAVINSTTLEEANSKIGNWIRQRSRWLKGYIQTYFVHTRHPLEFIRSHGIHGLIFHLVVGGKIAFMLINPVLWLATISYFVLYNLVGPAIESLYPREIFYIAVFSLVFGNFLCLYYYMIGCVKREHWSIVKYIYLVPFYWLMVSMAAVIAVVQLVYKPHYWEKTVHGFHLDKSTKDTKAYNGQVKLVPALSVNANIRKHWPAFVLVLSSLMAAFFNYLYNAYLGRMIPLEEFAWVSVSGSFLYLSQIPIGALSLTMVHQSAWLLGKYKQTVYSLWVYFTKKVTVYAAIAAFAWIALIPLFIKFFNTGSPIPFLAFAPVWLIGALVAVNNGFLSGNLKFIQLSAIVVLEAILKFLFAYLIVYYKLNINFVYFSLPLSMLIAYISGWLYIRKFKTAKDSNKLLLSHKFSLSFFNAALVNKISAISFLSLDVILVKHYFSASDTGKYGLLSLVGKMIVICGGLFSQFMLPFISKSKAEGRNSSKTFSNLLILTALSSIAGYLVVGLFAHISVPLLFGDNVVPIVGYLPIYALSMVCFNLGSNIIVYYQANKKYFLSYASIIFSLVQVILIYNYHQTLTDIVLVMFFLGAFYLFSLAFIDMFYDRLVWIGRAFVDLFGLFAKPINNFSPVNKNAALRMLIFNWRDTKHVWAGGAEVYVQEIAKELVNQGHRVTLFCGNDGNCLRNEVIGGVQIVRRGGFYTVYIWAFLYYILRFRGYFDVIIDSQNGIPFFTPFYALKPKFLLIHHVHQTVFNKHLRWPFANLAVFIETKVMPFAYRNQKIITVSNSSKTDIIKAKIGKGENIEIVHPAIKANNFLRGFKTEAPSFLYLGRLKAYKNIDLTITAFSEVVKLYKNAKLVIAGEGESLIKLKKLVSLLALNESVIFTGKVNEEEKIKLLSRSWVFIQTSLIEGWGITVIEANACGTPVIAANVAGLKDSVVHNKTGVLVPPGSVASLAAAMKILITNTAFRVKLSREAYQWSKNFSWEKSASEFLRIIHQSLNDKEINLTGKLVLQKVNI